MSLKKEILFKLIAKHIKNPELLWLTKLIIFNDPIKNFTSKGDRSLFNKIPPHKSLFHVPENQGLPIGNLTSQFFANIYLNELDQFAKHKLKVKYYFRYVDDFLILSCDKEQLKEWRDKIDLFLKEHLQLELNLQKQILQTTDKGINWLGYIIKPQYVLVRRRIVKTLKHKLFLFNQTLENYSVRKGQLLLPIFENCPSIDPVRDKIHTISTLSLTKISNGVELIEKMLATINSYFGHFKHANTFNLRKHLWENHFGLLQKYLEPIDSNLSYFRLKEQLKTRYQKFWRASEYK